MSSTVQTKNSLTSGPIIWCVMATQLLISFFMNPYIRNKHLSKAADAAKS